jgi:RNA polymerase sigma-70 factor (ECF subfamily)
MMPAMAMSPSSGPIREEHGMWVPVLESIALGDEAALAQLYDGTSRAIYGLVLRIVRDTAAAEDITLEVFMQVWRTAGGFSPSRGTVLGWMAMVARSRALDWLRSKAVRLRQLQSDLSSVPEVTDSRATPERAYADAGQAQSVRRALNTLLPAQREVIELGFFDGLSHSEIAERLNLPVGTVKSRIRSGMLKLREILQFQGVQS